MAASCHGLWRHSAIAAKGRGKDTVLLAGSARGVFTVSLRARRQLRPLPYSALCRRLLAAGWSRYGSEGIAPNSRYRLRPWPAMGTAVPVTA